MTPFDPRFFETADELRDWLEANHETASELIVGGFGRSAGRASVTWEEIVDEALCFGWIDSHPAGACRAMRWSQRLTPRRKGSNWSRVNIDNVARLHGGGPDAAGGIAAFDAPDARRGPASTRTSSGIEARLTDDEEARVPGERGRPGRGSRRGPPATGQRRVLVDRRREASRDARATARRPDRGVRPRAGCRRRLTPRRPGRPTARSSDAGSKLWAVHMRRAGSRPGCAPAACAAHLPQGAHLPQAPRRRVQGRNATQERLVQPRAPQSSQFSPECVRRERDRADSAPRRCLAGSAKAVLSCVPDHAAAERVRPCAGDGRGKPLRPSLMGRSEARGILGPADGRPSLVGHRAEIAQLVEHATENRGVASSILALGTIASAVVAFIERKWLSW